MDLLPGRLIRCLGYSGIDMQWISHFIVEIPLVLLLETMLGWICFNAYAFTAFCIMYSIHFHLGVEKECSVTIC